MPIQISCPTCQRQLRVPDNLIGQMVKCPGCENTFVATAEEPAPAEERVREPSARQRDDEPREETRPSRRQRDDADDDLDDDDRPRRRRRNYIPHRGTLILVLGILSFTGAGIFTGLPAWIMGNSDLKQMRAGTMDPEGESNTNIGRILGMVSTFLGIIGCGCGCLWMLLVVGAGAAGHK